MQINKKWQIFISSVLLLFTIVLTSCTKQPENNDPRRDQMVSSYSKVIKVLAKQLNLSKDRIMVNLSLEQLGVNDSNKLELQEALEAELGVKVPYSRLSGKSTVSSVISYVAIQTNNEIRLRPNKHAELLTPPREDINKEESKEKTTKEKKKPINATEKKK